MASVAAAAAAAATVAVVAAAGWLYAAAFVGPAGFQTSSSVVVNDFMYLLSEKFFKI